MNQNNFNDFHQFDHSYQSSQSASISQGKYAAKTFGWMFVGLMVTFLVTIATYYSGLLALMLANPLLYMGLFVAEVIVVVSMSVKLHSLSVGTARVFFLVYAALNGVTLSTICIGYGFGTAIFAFLLASLYFGALALFGYTTNVDLSKMGPFLLGGFVFLIISNFALMFFDMPGFERFSCLIGIAIFLAIVAYDTQKIKRNYQMHQNDAVMLGKASIYSALELYLDFINLFMYLLRYMGKRD